MATDISMIEGAYLQDILDQPRALHATVAGLNCPDELQSLAARLRDGEFRNVVLTGMGSSFHALHPSNIQLVRQGAMPVMVETSELIHYQSRYFDPRTLIVAVSQSGQSVEMLRLLEVNCGKSAIVAVTNTSDSPLAQNADAVIVTEAGEEFSVSCKTYVAALAALQWLTAILCGADLGTVRQELQQAAPLVLSYLQNWQLHVEAFTQLLEDTSNLFLVGRGASLAAVGTGALIVKESDHFPAEGMSSAAFRHGPFEMLSDENFVLVFAGDELTRDLNVRLVNDICEKQGRTALAGEDTPIVSCKLPPAPSSIRPILEILPVHMITLALAALEGREPGRFELATKITIRE